VTFGNEELARQVEYCEIADYDVTGWCDVNVLDGPATLNHRVDGPALDLTEIESIGSARPDVPPTSFLIRAGGRPVRIAPVVAMDAPRVYRVETILWTTDDGMLYTVEVISYGDGYVIDPYRLFVDVAASEPKRLQYPTIELR
jgi:hypothetical protein